MKKLVAIITFTLLSGNLLAQQRTTFSIRAGYAAYNIHGKDGQGEKFWLKAEEGFSIGMDVEFPIAKKVYLLPGLVYNQKGANFDSYLYMGTVYKGDVKLSYVEIPVNIVFKPRLGRGHLIVGAGPYLGLGIGREAGVEQGVFNLRFETDVSVYQMAENPFYFSPWDAGANFILGYQLPNNLYAQLNGQVGMKRINPSVNGVWEGNAKHRNIGVGLVLGYRF